MKILVIGSPGAGKSTFAKKLGEALAYPILHLDQVWHQTDYSLSAKTWFETYLINFMAENTDFIIDGNYKDTLSLRIKEADWIIWLKITPVKAVYRIIKRSFKTRFLKVKREDMASDFKEKLDKEYLEFLTFVWKFQKKQVPAIEKIIKENKKNTSKVVVLCHSQEKKQLLEQMKKSPHH